MPNARRKLLNLPLRSPLQLYPKKQQATEQTLETVRILARLLPRGCEWNMEGPIIFDFDMDSALGTRGEGEGGQNNCPAYENGSAIISPDITDLDMETCAKEKSTYCTAEEA